MFHNKIDYRFSSKLLFEKEEEELSMCSIRM
jgi:hypothetical protein